MTAESRPPGVPAVDVVVLAGGTGRRLGGASKPDVVARGARLLDHVLSGVAGLREGRLIGPGRTVVVAPPEVAVAGSVLRTLEDPPLGGPVAGVAAGLAAPGAAPAGLTAVLACDAPDGPSALPALLAALAACPWADGACVRSEGFAQHLLGVYRTAALSAAVAPGGRALRDVSVKRTLGALRLTQVDTAGVRGAAADLDTWAKVKEWDETHQVR